MKMQDVRERAKIAGVTKIGRMNKADLIRATQTTEGNHPCFQADWSQSCAVADCCWREACLG